MEITYVKVQQQELAYIPRLADVQIVWLDVGLKDPPSTSSASEHYRGACKSVVLCSISFCNGQVRDENP